MILDMLVVIWRKWFPEKLTEVDADFYNGITWVFRDIMIKERSAHVARSVEMAVGIKRDKMEIYAYSIEDRKELDYFIDQGYDYKTSKGERVVIDFKGNEIKKFKGKKLNVWESRSIIRLHKDTVVL
jgi:hypothetical protein